MASLESTSSANPHLKVTPISFSRILVGLDFSKPSERALQVAATIAELFEGELTVAHALPLFVPSVDAAGPIPEATEAMLQSAETRIRDAVGSIGAGDAHFRTVVAFDGAVELLSKKAEEIKADLLVLGSHAASGPARIMLGSVAETVLRHTSCPVLIAGPQCRQSSHPFRSILFATDLSETGLRPAQYAVALAEQHESRLTFIHVLEKKETMASGAREEEEQACMHQLGTLMPESAELWCRPQVEFAYGKPSEEILAAASNCMASLIVLGAGEHGALADHSPWSTIGQILHQSTCPILVVPGYKK